MLSDAPPTEAATPGGKSSQSTLPDLRRLASSALIACLPVIGVAFVLRFEKFGIGVLSGYAICVALYAFLRTFVTKGMDLIVGGIQGRADRSGDGLAKAKFAALSVGKFIVIGALMYSLLGMLHVNMIGFIAGFLVSQASITLVTLTRLKKTPRF
jgi:hypothetical protein